MIRLPLALLSILNVALLAVRGKVRYHCNDPLGQLLPVRQPLGCRFPPHPAKLVNGSRQPVARDVMLTATPSGIHHERVCSRLRIRQAAGILLHHTPRRDVPCGIMADLLHRQLIEHVKLRPLDVTSANGIREGGLVLL